MGDHTFLDMFRGVPLVGSVGDYIECVKGLVRSEEFTEEDTESMRKIGVYLVSLGKARDQIENHARYCMENVTGSVAAREEMVKLHQVGGSPGDLLSILSPEEIVTAMTECFDACTLTLKTPATEAKALRVQRDYARAEAKALGETVGSLKSENAALRDEINRTRVSFEATLGAHKQKLVEALAAISTEFGDGNDGNYGIPHPVPDEDTDVDSEKTVSEHNEKEEGEYEEDARPSNKRAREESMVDAVRVEGKASCAAAAGDWVLIGLNDKVAMARLTDYLAVIAGEVSDLVLTTPNKIVGSNRDWSGLFWCKVKNKSGEVKRTDMKIALAAIFGGGKPNWWGARGKAVKEGPLGTVPHAQIPNNVGDMLVM